jgi:hypothetical protein
MRFLFVPNIISFVTQLLYLGQLDLKAEKNKRMILLDTNIRLKSVTKTAFVLYVTQTIINLRSITNEA